MPRCTERQRGPLAAVLLLAAAGAWSFEDGAPAGHTGGFGEPDCTACHSDYPANPGEGRLEVRGWPERAVAGRSYRLTLVLEHPALASGGFQLSVRSADGAPAGILTAIGGDTRVESNGENAYLQHTHPQSEPGPPGRAEWAFEWTAGDDGAVILNAAANAANDDLSALGDVVLTLERRLEIAPPSGPAVREPTGCEP